jgi:hypothetical protein
MLGGLVGVYVSIQKELTAIKTRLEIDDKGAVDREKLRKAEIDAAIRVHEEWCARREPTGVRAQPPLDRR